MGGAEKVGIVILDQSTYGFARVEKLPLLELAPACCTLGPLVGLSFSHFSFSRVTVTCICALDPVLSSLTGDNRGSALGGLDWKALYDSERFGPALVAFDGTERLYCCC